jgi:hypothetical protein
MIVNFLKLLEVVDMDGSFPMRCYMQVWTYGSKVMRFLRFQVIFGHAINNANAANSAQICPKLPKSTQSQNFEIPPKIGILVFFKNKIFCM